MLWTLASIISVMFLFSGGLVYFSYLVTHCLHNFWQGNTSLNPFSFSILAMSRLITLWTLLLQQWDFKMLQHLLAFLSNTFPKNCSWWKQIVNTLSFSSNNLALQSKIHCKSSSSSLIFFFLSVEHREVYHKVYWKALQNHLSLPSLASYWN